MRARTSLVIAAAMVWLLFATATADANVSLKNGNFFIGYTDILYPGGFEPKVDRVYNSKTAFKGGFGWGWGMGLEVYLVIDGDGSITVHEYGGGAENVFEVRGHPTADEIGAEVDKIVSLRGKPVGEVVGYRRSLLADAGFREDEWEKLVREKLATSPDVVEGTIFSSDRFSHQQLTRTREGYQRLNDGKTELFSREGHLIRVTDSNRNELSLGYDTHGLLESLEDNYGRRITLTRTAKGLISGLLGKDGRHASYRYNDWDELVYCRDAAGNTFEYGYDSLRRHNMIRIGFDDNTTMEMGYHSRDLGENIRFVKDRDGTTTVYDSLLDPADHRHFTIAVETVAQGGQIDTSASYEYLIAHDSEGVEYTAELMTVIDGDRTDTTYGPSCTSLPRRIRHGGEETSFEVGAPACTFETTRIRRIPHDDVSFDYDAACHVTRKETPTEVTTLAYDPVAGKVTRVERESKYDAEKTWSAFRYDSRGNLVYAENSEGSKLALQYDDSGRISTIVDQVKNRSVSFVYNQDSKPTEITVQGVGTLTVTYTSSGEIAKVESTAGREAALAVTSAFQDLLDVIRPAGVSLSF